MNIKLIITPRGSAQLEILSGSFKGLTKALPEIRSTLNAVRKEFWHAKKAARLHRMSKSSQELYRLGHEAGWCDLHHRGFPKGQECLGCLKDKMKAERDKKKEIEKELK